MAQFADRLYFVTASTHTHTHRSRGVVEELHFTTSSAKLFHVGCDVVALSLDTGIYGRRRLMDWWGLRSRGFDSYLSRD